MKHIDAEFVRLAAAVAIATGTSHMPQVSERSEGFEALAGHFRGSKRGRLGCHHRVSTDEIRKRRKAERQNKKRNRG